jgi:sugar phosphate isomerase/epimerase
MEPKSYRHLWGYPITSEATYQTIRQRGYAGIESGMLLIDDPASLRDALKRYELELIGQVYTAGFSKGHTVDTHLQSLEEEVHKLQPLQPVLINVHSGEDTWSIDEMHRYFRGAVELEKTLDVPVAHETHRGRCLFHPAVARTILESHPEIKLVADLSHWVCVCERLIDDQEETIRLAAERTVHVHTRVGYDQGPQVSDPRCDQAADQRDAFEAWWRLIFDAMKRRGLQSYSFCPEYGPAPYMPLLPFTGMPVTDLEGICNWQADRIRQLVRRWQQ